MKSTLAAAPSKNVGVVIDDFVFAGLHSMEDFLPFYNFADFIHFRRLDVFPAPSRDGIAAG